MQRSIKYRKLVDCYYAALESDFFTYEGKTLDMYLSEMWVQWDMHQIELRNCGLPSPVQLLTSRRGDRIHTHGRNAVASGVLVVSDEAAATLDDEKPTVGEWVGGIVAVACLLVGSWTLIVIGAAYGL